MSNISFIMNDVMQQDSSSEWLILNNILFAHSISYGLGFTFKRIMKNISDYQ